MKHIFRKTQIYNWTAGYLTAANSVGITLLLQYCFTSVSSVSDHSLQRFNTSFFQKVTALLETEIRSGEHCDKKNLRPSEIIVIITYVNSRLRGTCGHCSLTCCGVIQRLMFSCRRFRRTRSSSSQVASPTTCPFSPTSKSSLEHRQPTVCYCTAAHYCDLEPVTLNLSLSLTCTVRCQFEALHYITTGVEPAVTLK